MQREQSQEVPRIDLLIRFNAVGAEWSRCMAIEISNLLVPEPEYLSAKQINAHTFFIEMVAEMAKLTRMPGTWLLRAENLWQLVVIYHDQNLVNRWIVSGVNAFLDIFIKAMQGVVLSLELERAEEVIRFMEEYLEPYRRAEHETTCSLN